MKINAVIKKSEYKMTILKNNNITNLHSSGFGGLEDACWPLVPKFAGSNPAEAVGFFRV
jgi:hypothetical protein